PRKRWRSARHPPARSGSTNRSRVACRSTPWCSASCRSRSGRSTTNTSDPLITVRPEPVEAGPEQGRRGRRASPFMVRQARPERTYVDSVLSEEDLMQTKSIWMVALAAAALVLATATPARDLTVVSWGGAYQDAQRDV